MNLTTRAVIAVVATAAIVGLAGAYIGADALQGDEPSPAADTPPPSATPAPAATPALTIPVCKDSGVDARTAAPTPGDVTKQYADISGAYSLAYPEEWEVCQIQPDPEIRDLASWINFIAQDQFPHASVLVYANPDSLSLEKWIQEHNPIFLDPERMAEERTIAGQPALFTATDAESLPRGTAYLYLGDQILLVTTLRLVEFERFANGIVVSGPSDWKEYTDPELGFTIFAPDGLERTESVVQLTAIGKVPATKLSVITFADPTGRWVVGVSETPNPAGLSLEDWIRTVPGWPCEPGASPTCEPEEVTVRGERGIRFSIGVIGDPTATVYLAHKDSIYILNGNIHGDGQGPPLSEDEFKIFLERFRFGSTSAATTASVPSNWKEYTDSALGFSLRFPPDLIAKDVIGPTDGTVILVGIEFRSGKDSSRGFTIAVYTNAEALTAGEWMQEFSACLPETVRQGSVAGQTAVFCTSVPLHPEMAVAFEHQGLMYYVAAIIDESEFESVLSSLRP